MKQPNKLIFILIFSIFLYLLYLILFNVNKGFELSDESFYIANYSYPNDIFSAAITLFRYPLYIFNQLFNENLPVLRGFSIVSLIMASAWLGFELLRYLKEKFVFEMSKIESLTFMIVLSIGSFSLFADWIITPSYNWIAMISIILYYAMLFKIVVDTKKSFFKYTIFTLLLVLSFLGKPTTTIALIIVGFIFLLYEYKRVNIKTFFISSILSGLIMLVLIILTTYGSFENYYQAIQENINLMKILSSHNTNLLTNINNSFDLFFEKTFSIIDNYQNFYLYLYGFTVVFFLISLYLESYMGRTRLYIIFSIIVVVVYSFLLWEHLKGIDNDLTMSAVYLNDLVFICAILIIIYVLFSYIFNFYKENNILAIKWLELLFLATLVLFGLFAFSFGSSNSIIYTASKSLIFTYTAILILNLILWKKTKNSYLYNSVLVLLSLYMILVINKALENPYRLSADMSYQKYPVSFINKNYTLYVDKSAKEYIESLKVAVLENGIDKSTYLIDLTGMTPGSYVITDAKFFDRPWLMGAYKGSDDFVYNILKKFQDTKELQNAWILIAPKSKLAINLKVLNRLGLPFPKKYKKVATLKSSYLGELQELWIPSAK